MATALPQAFARLGIPSDADQREIRRAYARELKLVDQEADPAAFQQLREAYELALEAAPGSTLREPAAPATPELEARETLAWIMAAVTVVANGRRIADESIWVDALREQLAEHQPTSIDGAWHLEAAIGRLLSQGWKPGHEALLIAATEHFGWDETGRWPNLHIAEAWFERFILHRQPEVLRAPLLRLIRDLRQEHDPDIGRLRREHGYLEHFSSFYANLAPVIVCEQRLLRWQELAAPLGTAPDVSWVPPKSEDDESELTTIVRSVFVLLLIIIWISLSNKNA